MAGLSRNQKRIFGILQIKPEMTAKDVAEIIFDKIVEYKSKEYASVYRNLVYLEKHGYIKRVQIHLRWRIASQ